MASSSSDDKPDQTPPTVPSTASSVSPSPKGPTLPLHNFDPSDMKWHRGNDPARSVVGHLPLDPSSMTDDKSESLVTDHRSPTTARPATQSRALAEASPASSAYYKLRASRKIDYSSAQKEQETEPSVVIPLTPDEIEADFVAMTGSKPPSRPRRHPMKVRTAIDKLSPGQQLTNITEEKYNLPDKQYRKV